MSLLSVAIVLLLISNSPDAFRGELVQASIMANAKSHATRRHAHADAGVQSSAVAKQRKAMWGSTYGKGELGESKVDTNSISFDADFHVLEKECKGCEGTQGNSSAMQDISNIHSAKQHLLDDIQQYDDKIQGQSNGGLELTTTSPSLLEILGSPAQVAPFNFKISMQKDIWVLDKQSEQAPFGSHDWVSGDANKKIKSSSSNLNDLIKTLDQQTTFEGSSGIVYKVDDGNAIVKVLKGPRGTGHSEEAVAIDRFKELLNVRQEFDTMVAVYSQMDWQLNETLLETNLPPLTREIFKEADKPDRIKLRFDLKLADKGVVPEDSEWPEFYLKMPALGTDLRSFMTEAVKAAAQKLAAGSEAEAEAAKGILDKYYKTLFTKFLPSLTKQLQALHSARIYHFDIKPANLLVGENGTARIIDWDGAFQFNEAEQGRMDRMQFEDLKEVLPFPRTTQYSTYSKGLPLQFWTPFAAALSMADALFPLLTEQPKAASSSNSAGTAFSHLVLHHCKTKTADMPKLVSDDAADPEKVVESIFERMGEVIQAGNFKWSADIQDALPTLKPLMWQALQTHGALGPTVFKALDKMMTSAANPNATTLRDEGFAELKKAFGVA